MRDGLTDDEWTAIKPMLPNKVAWRSSGKRPSCPRALMSLRPGKHRLRLRF
jgi:hypothetical protein